MFRHRLILLSMLVGVGASAARAADLPLSTAQVERVTGQSGLSTKPAKYDKLGTNFVTPQGGTVITLKVGSSSLYDLWKSQPAMNDQVALPGVGEDAVVSRKGRYICFKKASLGACVVGDIGLPGRPVLASDEQLVQLARLAAQ